MKFQELRTKYTNRDQGYERVCGRYYCSEIGKMRPKAYFKLMPKNFFDKKEIDKKGSSSIERGNAYEAHFERMLVALEIPHQYEPKRYCYIETETLKERWMDYVVNNNWLLEDYEKCYAPKVGEIRLTVKPDFVFPEYIIETKAPATPPTTIPNWYKDQLCCEQKAFGLPTYLGIFIAPFNLKTHLYEYEESHWEEIKVILVKFDTKLKKLIK